MSGSKIFRIKAFTLAEILIVLGIIGIVAALTIPQLIINYQKRVAITKLKKAYSTINQAMLLAINEHGDYNNWEDAQNIGYEQYYDKYILPYIKEAVICDQNKASKKCDYFGVGGLTYGGGFLDLNGTFSAMSPNSSNCLTFLLPDNTVVIYFMYFGDNVKSKQVFLDINGVKKPNTIGKDVFAFDRSNGLIVPQCINNNTNFINQSCSTGGTGLCCAEKIIRESWKISDDYPW